MTSVNWPDDGLVLLPLPESIVNSILTFILGRIMCLIFSHIVHVVADYLVMRSDLNIWCDYANVPIMEVSPSY